MQRPVLYILYKIKCLLYAKSTLTMGGVKYYIICVCFYVV